MYNVSGIQIHTSLFLTFRGLVDFLNIFLIMINVSFIMSPSPEYLSKIRFEMSKIFKKFCKREVCVWGKNHDRKKLNLDNKYKVLRETEDLN